MELGLAGLTPHGLGLLVDLPLLANGLARHLLSVVVGKAFVFPAALAITWPHRMKEHWRIAKVAAQVNGIVVMHSWGQDTH